MYSFCIIIETTNEFLVLQDKKILPHLDSLPVQQEKHRYMNSITQVSLPEIILPLHLSEGSRGKHCYFPISVQ